MVFLVWHGIIIIPGHYTKQTDTQATWQIQSRSTDTQGAYLFTHWPLALLASVLARPARRLCLLFEWKASIHPGAGARGHGQPMSKMHKRHALSSAMP